METNSRFIDDIPGALAVFPGLYSKEANSGLIIAGKIDLVAEGILVDSYEIEVHSTKDYPYAYPLVYEVGGLLPHNIDWHIYQQGHWCIGTRLEERINCLKGITLKSFLMHQVTSFLFSQTFRRENGYFYRERSHGLRGILEYYLEVFKLPAPKLDLVKKAFEIACSDQEPNSDHKCFCGSGKKYRKCHRLIIRPLSKAGKDIIKQDKKILDF